MPTVTGRPGLAPGGEFATDTEQAAAIEAHRADTTTVHGITDTSVLVVDADLYQTSNGNAFLAGGSGNTIADITARASDSRSGHVEGYGNTVHDYYGHAEGGGCIVDGKIAHAEGNACMCSANDSHAEGNRTVTGRRYYSSITTGSEDAGGGLGTLQYVVIPDTYGDVSSHFPNALTDNVTSRYGSGAQLDTLGNAYASGYTPAVWSGETLTTANDLQWALHRVCVLRGPAEPDIEFATIKKTTYSGGTGTKVYYAGSMPFASLIGVYGSYSPVLLGGGNGTHAEGYVTSAVGYGAHAEGYVTRAWAEHGAHAEGRETLASGDLGSHAEGYLTVASGTSAHAEGDTTTASGVNSHAEGDATTASGTGSHAQGASTVASGTNSHAEGSTTTASALAAHAQGQSCTASGESSAAAGLYAVASRNYQNAYASGRRSVTGDNQTTTISYGKSCADAGWHNLNILLDLVDDRTYHFETMVIGRQTAAPSAGVVGNSFAYRITGAITTAAGALTVLGTQTVSLVGRTSGMTGDGLTTGPRVTAYTSIYNGDLICRYDGEAGGTFYITTHNTIQELA